MAIMCKTGSGQNWDPGTQPRAPVLATRTAASQGLPWQESGLRHQKQESKPDSPTQDAGISNIKPNANSAYFL